MDDALIARLDEITSEHLQLVEELAAPDVLADRERYVELAKKASELEDLVRAYESWSEASKEADEARELAGEAKSPDEQ